MFVEAVSCSAILEASCYRRFNKVRTGLTRASDDRVLGVSLEAYSSGAVVDRPSACDFGCKAALSCEIQVFGDFERV